MSVQTNLAIKSAEIFTVHMHALVNQDLKRSTTNQRQGNVLVSEHSGCYFAIMMLKWEHFY